MTGLLVLAMLLVSGYCLARSVFPGLLGPTRHHTANAWHALMSAAMVVMLVLPHARWFSVIALAAFAVGAGWSLVQAIRRTSWAVHLGLGVGCAAMLAMLVPPAAAAGHPGSMTGAMASAMAGRDSAMGSLPGAVVAVLLVGLTVLFAAGAARALRGSQGAGIRLDAGCEAAMAAAMGYLLLMMA